MPAVSEGGFGSAEAAHMGAEIDFLGEGTD